MRLLASCRWVLAGLLVLLLAAGAAQQSEAAPGNLLFTLTRPNTCYGQAGVGVAFPPPTDSYAVVNLQYSCQYLSARQASNVLQWFDVGSLPNPPGIGSPSAITDDDGHIIPIEALTYDPNENILWAVDRIPVTPGPGIIPGICAVWRLDWPATGHAKLAFAYADPSGGCDFYPTQANFFDGLAVDPATDTLYLSPANAPTIRHLNKDGSPAANDPIDFASLTSGLCGGSSCASSGLLFGANGHLISATGESGKLVEIDPSAGSVVAVHNSGAGRDWGLSCGPVFTLPDGSLTNTIVSADLLSPNLNLIEAPAGVCDVNDYAVRNPILLPVTPGGEFGTGRGKVVYKVFGAEYIGFGSETVAAGDMRVGMSVNLDSRAVPHRIVAAAGDRCLAPSGLPLAIAQPVPCAEGDTQDPQTGQFPPSVGGWACYDGSDNDGDGLRDNMDPDCQRVITSIYFTAQAGQYHSFYRAVAFLCYVPSPLSGYSGNVNVDASGPVRQTNFPNSGKGVSFKFQCGSS